MNLTEETRSFLSTLSNTLDITEEQIFELIDGEVQGSKFNTIENGDITYLNVRGIAHAKSDLLRKKGIRERTQLLNGSQLDISHLAKLSHLEFVAKPENEVSFSYFDFSQNPNLESLSFRFHKTSSIIISRCEKLKEIDCSSNELEELDLSKNTQLKKLNCQFNPIKSLNLSQNSKLTYLLANRTELDENTLILPENNHISELHLSNTKFNNLDLSNFPFLTVCRLGGLNQKELITDKNPQLISFQLHNCQLDYLNIKTSQNLTDLVTIDTSINELVCNEFQALAHPWLAKQLGLSANDKQKQVLETLDLHKQASTHNWDEGLNKLKKILKNPNCDIATATLIYWLANPNYFLEYKKVNDAPDHSKELFRFINKLEKQLINKEFNQNIVDFDPHNFKGEDWTLIDQNEREIPTQLTNNIVGTKSEVFNYDKEYIGKM